MSGKFSESPRPPLATSAQDGLLSAADKAALDAGLVGPEVLGYTAFATSNLTTTATALADMTGATLTVTLGSRPVVVTLVARSIDTTCADTRVILSIHDVTGGTQVRESVITCPNSQPVHLEVYANPGAGSRQYKVQWRNVNAGTATLTATATAPAYLLVREV